MRLVLLCLLVGAAMTATGALADNNVNLPSVLRTPQPTGAACASLQRQFDQAITTRANAPKAATARVHRRKGEQECNTGHYDTGVKDLVRALHDIDVQPTMQ